MSLFDLQDVCIAIGSLATLDLPMVVDLIGIYGLKGPYYFEEVKEKVVVEKVVKATVKRRPSPTAEPVAMKKRTTIGRASPKEKDLSIVPVVQDTEPISVEETDEEEIEKEEQVEEETDKEKKDKEATDSKDTKPLRKVLKLTEPSLSDEESMPIDDILKQIHEDMMLPSILAEEPTWIVFGRGIEIKEVDWYKAILPKIDPMDKGKAPLVEEIKGNPDKEIFALIYGDIEFLVQKREAAIEEIVSFFNSLSIRGVAALELSAEFESGTPTSAIDLQVLYLLSDSHHLALIKLLEQLRQHKLEWTRPYSSNLFGGTDDQSRGIHSQFYPNVSSTTWVWLILFIDESWTVVQGANPKPARLAWPIISKQKKQLPQRRFVDAFAPICVFIEPVQDLDSRRPYSATFQSLWTEICTDVVQFLLFGHLQPVGSTYNTCRDIVSIDSDLDIDTVPTGIFDAFQHGQSVVRFVDFFVVEISSNSSSSDSSPSSSSTSSSSSSHDSSHCPAPIIYFDQIQLEQVQTRERVEELKSKLSQKVTKLELAFAQSTSRHDMVFRAQINEVRKEVQVQKAVWSQELTSFRLETQEGLSTLRAQLCEIIAYINRGRDDKRGEESSRGPQPEDRSRPSGGGSDGSRSEPPSKRGSGSHKGRGSRSSGLADGFLEKIFLFSSCTKLLYLAVLSE
ncbi:hypothetical protein F511_32104 [Dorcoceras hygrometricum]|uniref:Uncharacterized protein n=1 Tax=Dorcoceras hygrometricum TaxID=472368 RepID=A0A2Z7AWT7_9LAMI|nr:hypothetical protein F511_32104 [Dorcoceras hygrometricum]